MRTSPRRTSRRKEGFEFFKLKIGVKPLAKEIAIALAVRGGAAEYAALRRRQLRADLADARSYVEKTKKARLMFVEQPLGYEDIEGLRRLARGTRVPIGVDEGIHSFADIAASAKAGAGGVSLKLIKLGGISAAIEAGSFARARAVGEHRRQDRRVEHLQRGGAASGLRGAEGGLGRQPDALLPRRGRLRRPLPIKGGLVALPDGPGLGIEVDEAAVERFRVR